MRLLLVALLLAISYAQTDCTATHKEIWGSDVARVTYTGSTEEEKDASCCQQCGDNSECEFWVRETDGDHCWLKKGFTRYANHDQRRAGFKAGYQECGDYGNNDGTELMQTQAGSTCECQRKCSLNDACVGWTYVPDLWTRIVFGMDGNDCSLRSTWENVVDNCGGSCVSGEYIEMDPTNHPTGSPSVAPNQRAIEPAQAIIVAEEPTQCVDISGKYQYKYNKWTFLEQRGDCTGISRASWGYTVKGTQIFIPNAGPGKKGISGAYLPSGVIIFSTGTVYVPEEIELDGNPWFQNNIHKIIFDLAT